MMKTTTMEVANKNGKGKANFTLSTPENDEELAQVTGVSDPFGYCVSVWQTKVVAKMSRALFPHTVKAFGETKKMKALKGDEAIQKSIGKVWLVKKRRANAELTPVELRAQVLKGLKDAGHSAELINTFMEQYDSNMELAEAPAK
jgi:hypothetical protein